MFFGTLGIHKRNISVYVPEITLTEGFSGTIPLSMSVVNHSVIFPGDLITVDSTFVNSYATAEYTTPGTYSWTCPEKVYSVSVVAVGGGGAGGNGNDTGAYQEGAGGGGGGLGWKNNIAVVPGQTYTVVVGAGGQGVAGDITNTLGNGGDSYFISTSTVAGFGGKFHTDPGSYGGNSIGGVGGGYVGDGGGSGGNGGNGRQQIYGGGGGGGAGGYSGVGGNGDDQSSGYTGSAMWGTGGGGGGGHGGGNSPGGGVGIYGQGANGGEGWNSAEKSPTVRNGQPGSGGTGQTFGGGGGGTYYTSPPNDGGGGAVRIIWPGDIRTFPFNAANNITGTIPLSFTSNNNVTVITNNSSTTLPLSFTSNNNVTVISNNSSTRLSLSINGSSMPAYWISTLGGAGADDGLGIAVDSSNNVYSAGYTLSQGAGGYDVIITKYDTSGNIQWQRTLGGSDAEISQGSLAVDLYSNLYFTGWTSGASPNNIILAKYDTLGNIQWQRTLDGGASEIGIGTAVDSLGNVYISGRTQQTDALIIKYDTSGTLLWQRTLGSAGTEIGTGIAVDSSDNIYITGYADSQGAGGYDVVIAKYDTSGNIQWQRTLGSAGTEIGQGIAVDSSDNVYVVGYSDASGTNDILIAKYNTSGTIQWQRTLGGAGSDIGISVAIDSFDNVYITGTTDTQGGSQNNIFIAKYDTSGNIQWQRTLGSAGAEGGNGIAIGPSDNVYITGYVENDVLIAKLPSDGSLTGVYGTFTYAVSALSSSVSTFTSSVSTLIDATSTLTSSVSTFVSSTSTLTSTLIVLPSY